MEDYPKSVTKRCTQTILAQMNNNFIYKIKEKDGNFSNGFFCHIKYQKKNIPVVIINNHIIKDEIINVLINNDIKKIKLGKIGFIYEEYNISILEIEKNIDYNINYLELDDNIYENDSELIYTGNIDLNSHCLPIFNLSNNKIIIAQNEINNLIYQ